MEEHHLLKEYTPGSSKLYITVSNNSSLSYHLIKTRTLLRVQPVVPEESNTTGLKMPKSHVAFRHWLNRL